MFALIERLEQEQTIMILIYSVCLKINWKCGKIDAEFQVGNTKVLLYLPGGSL